MSSSTGMSPQMARGVGIDFGSGACRVAVQRGAAREVDSFPLPAGQESPKRRLGMQVPGNDARAAALLRSAREQVERRRSIRIRAASLAVPPAFEDKQKAAVKLAAEQAGIAEVRLVEEPVAAAVYYMNESQRRGRWLVYGLGQCVFYATLIDTRNGIDVKSHKVDLQLGGGDFDRQVVADLRRLQLVDSETPDAAVLPLAERCKRLLSFREQAVVQDFVRPDRPLCFSFSRAALEPLLEPAIGRTVDLARQLLEELSLAPSDIDLVLLVGESTRIPMVESLLLGAVHAPVERLSPDAICCGAAMLSTSLENCFEPHVASAPPSAAAPPQPQAAAEGPAAALAAALAAEGPERLRLYNRFLDEARYQMAFICIREASRQEAADRTRDAVATLESFLEWKTDSGKKQVRGKLADYYLVQAHRHFVEAQQLKRDDERRRALKLCRDRLNKCLEADPDHKEARKLKAALAHA